VVSIDRIQQYNLWDGYVTKKDKIVEQYRQKKTRKALNNKDRHEISWLFHGTASETIPLIILEGFNRSFAGENGTSYGEGSYFSNSAEYSQYFSKPDKSGIRKMLLCRVAIGDYCLGRQGMKTPDLKYPGTKNYERFDSSVDNISNPSIFVVYHDSQAYPEYIVTFTSN
jgi:poly [ADP-ribose] polymerase 10/14/15